jgi:hypothetical protein
LKFTPAGAEALRLMSASIWSRKFDEPIPLPRGRTLVTLRDAGHYILKLPESVHTAPEWQAAIKALGLVAALGGPTMFARIGIMRALNRHVGMCGRIGSQSMPGPDLAAAG